MALENNNKLELSLNEENEIGFKLRVEGSDKEIGTTRPQIRFSIIDPEIGRGWIFRTERGEEPDGIVVNIPNMKGLVREGKEYQGKLEVIFGTRFFTPTEVNIEFVEPLKIEASVVNNKAVISEKTDAPPLPSLASQEIKPLTIESNISGLSVVSRAPSKEAEKTPTPDYSKLDVEQKRAVNALFLQECKKLGVENPQKYFKDGTDYTKKRLRALMAKALLEHQKASAAKH